jgi:hypothetical protein
VLSTYFALCLACSGGEPAADAAEPSPPDLEVLTDGDAPPAGPTADVRLVNVWSGQGSAEPIDLTATPLFGEEAPLFEQVALGTWTAIRSVPADTRLEVHRSGEVEADEPVGGLFLTETDLEPGRSLTLIVGPVTPIREGGHTAGISIYYDTGPYLSGTMPAKPVDGGMLIGSFGPVRRLLGEAHPGLTLGTPGEGCLRPAGWEPSRPGIVTSVGGTALVAYDVEPGRHQIAAYAADDARCSGPPLVGPADVDVTAGGRTWIVAYGAGPGELSLVAVPAIGGAGGVP